MLSLARGKVSSAAQEINPSPNSSYINNHSNKPISRMWNGKLHQGAGVLVEPTSVLDIYSPSPSPTPSASLVVSSEGPLGSTESTAVAVSVLDKDSPSSQLPDCITSINQDTNLLWRTCSAHEAGEGTLAIELGELSNRTQYRDSVCGKGRRGKAEQLEIRTINAGNCLDVVAGGHFSGASLVRKLGLTENVRHAGQFSFQTTGGSTSVSAQGGMMNMGEMVKEDTTEGKLEACGIQCVDSRKRDQGDFLGEMVLKMFGHSNKKGGADWLGSEENESFSGNGDVHDDSDSLVEMVSVPDLSSPHGWSIQCHEDSCLHQQQASPGQLLCSNVIAGVGEGSGILVSDSNLKACTLAPAKSEQLDLYEAMQAGLLYNTSGKVWSGLSTNASLVTPVNLHHYQQSGISCLPPPASAVTSCPSHDTKVAHYASCTSLTALNNLVGMSNAPAVHPSAEHRNSSLHSPRPPPQMSPHLSLLSPQDYSSEFVTGLQPSPLTHSSCVTYSPLTIHEKKSTVELKPWQVRLMDMEGMMLKDGSLEWQDTVQVHPARWNAGLGVEKATGIASPSVLPTLLEAPSEHQILPMPRMIGRLIPLEGLLFAQKTLSAAMKALDQDNRALAQAILARLNHLSSVKGKPLERAIFYFKEALAEWVDQRAAFCRLPKRYERSLLHPEMGPNRPVDILSKIDAYKKFCEASPIPQFAHFTANQAILEAMENEKCIHIVDFELGLGGQWASFMQELAQRPSGPPDLLKVTTIGVPDSVEVQLAKENMVSFARELGLTLLFDAVSVPTLLCLKVFMVGQKERDAVVVNFGFEMSPMLSDFASIDILNGFFQFIKGLSPKVVTVMDSEFGYHMDSLQFFSCVFESLECLRLAKETVRHIEALLFGPKIATLVQRRVPTNSIGNLPPLCVLLQNMGFTLKDLSNATEKQAGYLIKNPSYNGFTLRKQHGYLYLFWINQPLLAASTWIC